MRCSRRIGIGVLVGATGLALSACGAASPSPRATAALSSATSTSSCSGPTVTATGSGTTSVAPDLLSVVLAVQTQSPSAQAALVDNNTRAHSVIATLEGAGVAKSDLQTTGLSVQPSYSHVKGVPSKIDGYQVDDTVTAQVHQLSSAGSVIDRAATQVGNGVSLDGISFSLQHPGSAEATAHTQAVQAALGEAQTMASAANAKLGTLCSVSDMSNDEPENFASSARAAALSLPAQASSVPVQSGSEQVTAQVKVVYGVAG